MLYSPTHKVERIERFKNRLTGSTGQSSSLKRDEMNIRRHVEEKTGGLIESELKKSLH